MTGDRIEQRAGDVLLLIGRRQYDPHVGAAPEKALAALAAETDDGTVGFVPPTVRFGRRADVVDRPGELLLLDRDVSGQPLLDALKLVKVGDGDVQLVFIQRRDREEMHAPADLLTLLGKHLDDIPGDGRGDGGVPQPLPHIAQQHLRFRRGTLGPRDGVLRFPDATAGVLKVALADPDIGLAVCDLPPAEIFGAPHAPLGALHRFLRVDHIVLDLFVPAACVLDLDPGILFGAAPRFDRIEELAIIELPQDVANVDQGTRFNTSFPEGAAGSGEDLLRLPGHDLSIAAVGGQVAVFGADQCVLTNGPEAGGKQDSHDHEEQRRCAGEHL